MDNEIGLRTAVGNRLNEVLGNPEPIEDPEHAAPTPTPPPENTTSAQQRSLDWLLQGAESLPATAVSNEPTDDAPGDDRSDEALKGRWQAFDDASNLFWLLDGTPAGGMSGADVVGAGVKLGDIAGRGLGYPRVNAGTLIRGLAESPRQALGGARDAAQSMLEFADWAEGIQHDKFDLGGVPIPLPYAPKEMREHFGFGELPDVGKPKTLIGATTRAVTSFWRF